MNRYIHIFICLCLAAACQARIINVDDDGPADQKKMSPKFDFTGHRTNAGLKNALFPFIYSATSCKLLLSFMTCANKHSHV